MRNLISILFVLITLQASSQTQEGHTFYSDLYNTLQYGREAMWRTDHANVDTLSDVIEGTVAYDTLNDVIIVYDGSSWVDVGSGGSGGGTLDDAYDFGGAGAGRTITADAGAVQINGPIVSEKSNRFLVNDSLDFGAFGKIPAVGYYQIFGSGIMYNSLADWTTLGGEPAEFRIGFGTGTGVNSDVKIDTNQISIQSRSLYLVSNNTGGEVRTVSKTFRIQSDTVDVEGTAKIKADSNYLEVGITSYDFGGFTQINLEGNTMYRKEGDTLSFLFTGRQDITGVTNPSWRNVFGFAKFDSGELGVTIETDWDEIQLKGQRNLLTSSPYTEIRVSNDYGMKIELEGLSSNDFSIQDSLANEVFIYDQSEDEVKIENTSLKYVDGNQANGAVLTSDADGNASWIAPSYSEMGFGDSLTTISLTQNVREWITNANNDLWSTGSITNSGDFVVADGDSIIIQTDGVYEISIMLSAEGQANEVIELGVLKNGTEDCFCTGVVELNSARIYSLNYQDIGKYVNGDVLKPFLMNTNDGNDSDVINGKMIVKRLK